METNAIIAGILLVISFTIRDLYLNDYATTPRTTSSEERKDEKYAKLDPFGEDLDLDQDSRQKIEKVERDDFFDEDDVDDNYKSGSPGIDMSAFSPGSRISSAKFAGPTLRFIYCTTSGYKNAYDQFVTILQEKHPELFVEGSTHPPTTYRRIGGQLVSIFKFIFIGSILASQYSFMHFIGIPVGITSWMAQNKVYAGLLCFFFSNFMESQLVATGAFEIYFDDVPIWSKLQTGRVPSPPELMQIIDNQLKMGGRELGIDGFSI